VKKIDQLNNKEKGEEVSEWHVFYLQSSRQRITSTPLVPHAGM